MKVSGYIFAGFVFIIMFSGIFIMIYDYIKNIINW
jgi:hypothetical protein